jgi:hypothetical protein
MWTEHGSGLLTFRLSAANGVSIHHCFANHVYICLVSFRPYVIEGAAISTKFIFSVYWDL